MFSCYPSADAPARLLWRMRAELARGVAIPLHCLSIRLSLISSPCRDCSARPSAIKARRAVSSAAPAGRTLPALASLRSLVRVLQTVAGGTGVANLPTRLGVQGLDYT